MSFWKNKHVIVATAGAPYSACQLFCVSVPFVGEKPNAAEAGQSYQLVEKPNCRYSSGYAV